MRALLSVMTNEPLLDEVKSHQAATYVHPPSPPDPTDIPGPYLAHPSNIISPAAVVLSLKELAQLKNGLAAMNKQSAEEYSKQAPDYMKAAHLARQVKTDLNDITKRISYVPYFHFF